MNDAALLPADALTCAQVMQWCHVIQEYRRERQLHDSRCRPCPHLSIEFKLPARCCLLTSLWQHPSGLEAARQCHWCLPRGAFSLSTADTFKSQDTPLCRHGGSFLRVWIMLTTLVRPQTHFVVLDPHQVLHALALDIFGWSLLHRRRVCGQVPHKVYERKYSSNMRGFYNEH